MVCLRRTGRRAVAAELVAEGPDVGGSEAEVSADGVGRGQRAAASPPKDRLARDAEKPGGLARGEEGSVSTAAHARTSRFLKHPHCQATELI